MAFKFKKVAIVGAGLMGGSLGRLLLKKKLAGEVVAVGRSLKRLNEAKKLKAATSVTTDIEAGVKDADLVVICVPVALIPVMFMKMQHALGKNTIVTDMGSVKAGVVARISVIDKNRNFVGSHPMVGSEKTGIKNIREEMFAKGACIVTPEKNTDKRKTAKVIAFWKKLGMKVMQMGTEEHDKAVSGLSHLPHLLSFLLVNSQAGNIKKHPAAVGSGFKDMTRIAASGEEIWSEIFVMNKKELLRDIDAFINALDSVRGVIEFNKMDEIKDLIKKARLTREKIK